MHRQISLDLARDKPPPLHPYSTSFNPPSTFSTFLHPFFQTAMMCQPHSSTDSTQCQTEYHPKSHPIALLDLCSTTWTRTLQLNWTAPTPLCMQYTLEITLRVCTHYKSYRKLILNMWPLLLNGHENGCVLSIASKLPQFLTSYMVHQHDFKQLDA